MADPPPTTGRTGNRLKQIVDRVKTSLKKRLSKSSKRQSNGGQEQGQTSQQPAATSISPAPESKATAGAPTEEQPQQSQEGRIAFRTTLDKKKVQDLFAKYGLDFDGQDIVITELSQAGKRVNKPVRMRIRRQCHQCQTTFGKSLVCSGCNHRYCRDCQRYPPKKPKTKDKDPAAEAQRAGKDVVEEPVEPTAAPSATDK